MCKNEDEVRMMNWDNYRKKLDSNLRSLIAIEEREQIEATIQGMEEDIKKTIQERSREETKVRSSKYGDQDSHNEKEQDKENRTRSRDPEDKSGRRNEPTLQRLTGGSPKQVGRLKHGFGTSKGSLGQIGNSFNHYTAVGGLCAAN